MFHGVYLYLQEQEHVQLLASGASDLQRARDEFSSQLSNEQVRESAWCVYVRACVRRHKYMYADSVMGSY